MTHVQISGVDVLDVGDFGPVDHGQFVHPDQRLDGVFGRLDQIVVAGAGEELGGHLFVGGVGFVVDLDAGLFGEAVDDFLGDVFGPGEEIEFVSLSGGGEGEEQEEAEEVFHGFSLGRRRYSAAAMSRAVPTMKTAETALSIGLSPTLAMPKTLIGSVIDCGPVVK